MIADFRCKHTTALFEGDDPVRFQAFASMALRKLDMLDAAASLEDLRVPPANHLEALKGDRAGRHSIRINAQWRVCFVWRDGPRRGLGRGNRGLSQVSK